MFRQLDALLKTDTNDGHWSELGIKDCVAVLSAFNAQDWIELGDATSSRSTDWLVRCADALGDVTTKESLDWLMKAATARGDEVAESALESIGCFIANAPSIHDHRPTLIAWFEELRPMASRSYLLALAALEANLNRRC